MKRAWAVFIRDMKSNLREFILIYILIAPLLLTLGLKLVAPDIAGTTGLAFAVHSAVDRDVVETFRQYGTVELYDDPELVKERVEGIDEVSGILSVGEGQYQVILEEEDDSNSAVLILSTLRGEGSFPVKVEFSDIGYKLPPVLTVGAASLILTAIVMSGMLMGLSIIEDKETDVISALAVSPLSRAEYIAGKTLGVLILSLINAYLVLRILGLQANGWMMFLTTCAGALAGLLFGLIIGVLARNQMSAIAVTKILFLPVSASVLGAIFLPQSLQPIMYWSPFYWSYQGFYGIITRVAGWDDIGIYSTWLVSLTAVFVVAGRGMIRRRLFAGDN